MGALRLLFRAEFRRRWRSWLALATLIAVVSGVVLAAAAAGRRTESAFPRFVAAYGFNAGVYSMRPAPKLVSSDMVKSMKPGSVLVDLAVERGGNVEGAKPGEVVDLDGIKIVGYTNVAGRVAASASSLYARNLFSFIETMVDKTSKALAVNWDDELVKATALTKDGAVVHPNFQPK